jgi:hypothetical protein
LGDLFEERIRDFNSKNRISAVKKYTTILKHLKELKLNTLPLDTLNKEHIRLFNMDLINKRKLSNYALRNYNKVMKTAITFAEDNSFPPSLSNRAMEPLHLSSIPSWQTFSIIL